jgi:hypothetical protein
MVWTGETWEWLKVAALCMLSSAVYYFCWVRYPPRADPATARWGGSHEDDWR